MSTIFSHAVNAIKSNRSPTQNLYQPSKKVISLHEPVNLDSASILNRIQPSKKHVKTVKAITIRKGTPDDFNDFDVSRIQKKVINKDLNRYLQRPSNKSEADELYRREVEEGMGPGVISRGNVHFVVFLKSLPRGADESLIRDMIGNNNAIIEIKMNNEKAAVEFYTKEGAKHAVDLLNNRIIRSSKIKAELVTEFNLSSFNPLTNKTEQYDSQEVERPNYYSKEELREKSLVANNDEEEEKSEQEEDDDDLDDGEEEEEKPSILSRIRKNR